MCNPILPKTERLTNWAPKGFGSAALGGSGSLPQVLVPLSVAVHNAAVQIVLQLIQELEFELNCLSQEF